MCSSTSADSRGIDLLAPVPMRELLDAWGGTLDPELLDRIVVRVSEPSRADSDSIAPVLSRRYLEAARHCCSVLLVDADLADELPQGSRWIHPHAAWVLAALLSIDSRDAAGAEVDPSARVAADVVLPKDIQIGAGAVLLSGCCLGPGCRIEPHAVIYGNVTMGARVLVGAGAVIGRPGFGWVHGPGGELRMMPQRGGVVVEDDVEIGALATVDSGTLHPTVLGRGCKLDAHVHVGHNVRIGAGSIVAAQAGFAGSARIGAGVLVGGQAGVADHVEVGDGARLAGKAGVIGNVPRGTAVAGYPAVERGRWLRSVAKALRGQPT